MSNIYKARIVEMIESINDESVLKALYTIVSLAFGKDGRR